MNTQQVLSRVALVFSIEPGQLSNGSRSRQLVEARQAAAFLLRFRLNASYSDIAGALGYADHTTARWAVQAAGERAKARPDYSDKIGQVGRM